MDDENIVGHFKYIPFILIIYLTDEGNPLSMRYALEDSTLQLKNMIQLCNTPLNKGDRQRIQCLILQDAHSREITETLSKERSLSVSDFIWQVRTRCYSSQDRAATITRFDEQVPGPTFQSRCIIRICDTAVDYGFEYSGNGSRLVITPLSDRVYVTVTQAIHVKMGCAVYGPSGSGKTETIRNLATLLGRCCYVFNCSQEMDFKSVGNIFKGLAASGAWGCFDDLNRIKSDVLSVCIIQFKTLTDALRNFTVRQANTGYVTIGKIQFIISINSILAPMLQD